MKKIISILLTAVIALSAFSCAYAKIEVPEYLQGSGEDNGGEVYYCETTDSTYNLLRLKGSESENCPCCNEVSALDHPSINIYFAIQCPKCKGYNTAYNKGDYTIQYANISCTAPDGTKVNECKFCGQIFYDLDNVSDVVSAAYRVISYDESTEYIYEKAGKTDNDISETEYLEMQKKNDVKAYFLAPLLKIYKLITSLPGYAMNIFLAFLSVVAPDIVTMIMG